MTEDAILKRREYNNAYRQKNRDTINARHLKWMQEHPEKCKEYQNKYWEKKAKE